MNNSPTTLPESPSDYQWQLREMNAALLISSVHEQELTELAQKAEALILCQKDSLEMVVKGEPLEQVLDFLARAMESQAQGRFVVAIHLLEADGYHFGYVAAPSLPARYAQATRGMDARLELGACSAAVVSHAPTVVRDFASETRWPAFTAEVLSLGLFGCFTTPILSSDQKALGTFAIYYREPGDPSPQDRLLVDFVTSTVALAIDRKQTEVALRESEERFRTMADNMSQFAWTADANGWIYWYNQRWYDYTGTTLEEMQGWGWKKVHHPDHVERVVERIQHSWDTGEPWEDTFPLRGKDGEYCWFLSRALPIRDERGNVVRWFGTNTDITSQRAMESRIKQQAEQLADESRRKDEFLAMLAHELRNPLAPISNFVQLLRLQKDENPLQKQARTVIERQVGQLTRLVDDLMEISRITTGRVQLRHDRVVIGGIVERAVETACPLLEQHGHELTVSLPPQPIWLDADAARLEQVVVNLLTNAAKYTPAGGHVWLTVEQEGDECVLRVRDTGIGIAPELLPRIFDLFTQAERSLDRSQGGLGIGLALVQRLVEMHRGTVQVVSVLGHGSELTVRLPVAPSPAAVPPSIPTDTPEATRPSLRVLVVDDNIDAAQTLALLLEATGHDVRTAHDGMTAVQAALDYRPNVVLLDIGLPGRNGYDVAKQLRQQPVLSGLVLVAMTGYGQESDRQLAQQAGFDHHLVKPADFSDVQQILATVAEKK